MKKPGHKLLLDCIAVTVIFVVSLSIRISYQHNSVINGPIRADAAKYFRVAFNLYHFHVYSPDKPPAPNVPPAENFSTPAPPGYPLFLYPFIATSTSSTTMGQFLKRVSRTQAILGSLTAVLTYMLARIIFSIPWAFLPGLLTALCPHLIACDHYFITESLFTFTVVLAVLVLVVSWRKNKPLLSIVSGMLFGYSVLVRPVSLLLCPFMGIAYFFNPRQWSLAPKRTVSIHIICILLGFAVSYAPYLVIRNAKTASSSHAVSVTGQSLWGNIVYGADINLKNWKKAQVWKDPFAAYELTRMIEDKPYGISVLKQRFKENPGAYLRWYLGGKILFMWQWDNMFNGDVYQYPMLKKGFKENAVLRFIHDIMYNLHWPLYILTLISPLMLLILRISKRLEPESVSLLPHILIFLYFAGLLTILHPMPRYAIPLRPFSYILAIASLCWIMTFIIKPKGFKFVK